MTLVGRESATDSLYDADIVTFEDDAGAYDQADAGVVYQTERAATKTREQTGSQANLGNF